MENVLIKDVLLLIKESLRWEDSDVGFFDKYSFEEFWRNDLDLIVEDIIRVRLNVLESRLIMLVDGSFES